MMNPFYLINHTLSYASSTAFFLALFGILSTIGTLKPLSHDSASDITSLPFKNNSPETTVHVSEFLSHTDLSHLTHLIHALYRDPSRCTFPPTAMLKLAFYFILTTKKRLTDLYRELSTLPHLHINMGFKPGVIPTYKTSWHFLSKRIQKEGIEELFTATLDTLRVELAKRSIHLGQTVATAATPLPARKSDTDSMYNAHYNCRCYKVQRLLCTATNIPIAFRGTNGNVYD